MDLFLSPPFWISTARIGVPLALAGLGVLISLRAGYLNIGVEGVMLFAAFFAVAGTKWTNSPLAGVALAVAVAVLMNLLVIALAIPARMGYVLAGIVVLALALGTTAFLARVWFPGGTALAGTTLRPIGYLHQQPLFYVVPLVVFGMHWFLRKSRAGLVVRSAGEGAEAAATFGVRVGVVRVWAAVVGGVLIGLAGASLSLGAVGSFSDNMTAGRGFIALACVILAGYRPVGVFLAAAFFGAADAIHFHLASRQAGFLGEVIVVLPYVATVVALGAFWGRSRGPSEASKDLSPRILWM